MYASDTSTVLLDPRSFTETSFFTPPFTIFYHIWLKTVSKGTRTRVGAGREESPSFTKITREMNQIHWRANNHFIYLENRCK